MPGIDVEQAKGRICSQTILDQSGVKIIGEGEVITNTTLEEAIRKGKLEDVVACAGLTTLPPPAQPEMESTPERMDLQSTWQPPLPPAAEEVIEEKEERE